MESNKMTENINLFTLPLFSEVDQPYDCNKWVIYKNKAYKSIKPNNTRHPHDYEYWYEVGGIKGLLDHLINDHKTIDLALPYYPECSNGCVAMFDKGQCVIDRIKVLNSDGSIAKDDCGNDLYELQIFTSLIDCNTDSPLAGSNKTPATWDGGYSTCGYLNRPVAYTQDGNTPDNRLYPDAPENLKCVLGCDAPDDETIALANQGTEGTHSQTIGNKLRVIHDNKSIVTSPEKGLEVAVIGRDRAGNPVDVRNNPCFVTCETMGKGLIWDETTKKWIVNIANGLSYTSDDKIQVQPANNSIIVDSNGVKVGQLGVDRNGQPVMAGACLVTCATDLHVTAIDDTGVNTVITLSDGTTISGPEIDKDDYVVNFVQSGGVLTITMKSGATYSVTLPVTQDNYLTNLTIDANGLITATRNNGLPDLSVQIPKPETLKFPMATYRGGYGPPAIDPNPFTANGKLHFSEWVNQSGYFPETVGIVDIPIPFSGWYRLDHRCTARWTGSAPPKGRCSVFRNADTSPIQGLSINIGTNYFPFMARNEQREIPKAVHTYLNAGDTISVQTASMGAGAEIIGETLMIKFESF